MVSKTRARESHSLVVTDGNRGFVVPLATTSRPFTLGREPSCEIRVDLPSVSRRHATVELAPRGRFRLADLGSKNGTFVEESRLATGQSVTVELGQPFRLGAVLAVFVSSAPKASRAREPSPLRSTDHDFVRTPGLVPIEAIVEKIAPTTLPVLLLGETGVGKDVIAERLHCLSPRRQGPLVRVHAAAIAEGLFESELFGHEAGAFTGASKQKIGHLESADGGTVFIDEVGELPLGTQVKLLRVLEDRRVQRVGATSSIRVDVRFVAATHVDLGARVAQGAFRADLFQRLRGVTLRIPPLRERRSDIAVLAKHLLARISPHRTFSKGALSMLAKMPFFGNVRELRNLVERTALLADEDEISADALAVGTSGEFDGAGDLRAAMVRDALERANGNQTNAAKLLGVSRRTLIHRLDELGLARPRKRSDATSRARSTK